MDDLNEPVAFTVSGAPHGSADGAVLHRGDAVQLSVSYGSGRQRFVYANVLDIGVAGRVAVLNGSESSGLQLAPTQTRAIGELPGGQAQAMSLFWPPGVPEQRPRFETFVAIFSDTPQDLRNLSQEGIASHRGDDRRHGSLELASLLQVGTRDVGATSADDKLTRFTIRRVTFRLCPGGEACGQHDGRARSAYRDR